MREERKRSGRESRPASGRPRRRAGKESMGNNYEKERNEEKRKSRLNGPGARLPRFRQNRLARFPNGQNGDFQRQKLAGLPENAPAVIQGFSFSRA